MYIPTQEERYSKIAKITLFLCVIVPSAVVAWLAHVAGWLGGCIAFLHPIASPLALMGVNPSAALCLSALVQGMGLYVLLRSKSLSAKAQCTVAITWGMTLALLLRLMIAFEAWLAVHGGMAE